MARPWNNPGMTARLEELVAEGRAALRAGDAAGARRALDQAVGASSNGDVIESLARASYLELDYLTAIDGWERAYAAHRDAGDHVGAVRVARSLSYMYMAIVGDRAISSGWLSRPNAPRPTRRSQPNAGGWRSTSRCSRATGPARRQLFREALAVARSFGDTDLEFVTLAYLGASLVHADRTEEGMLLLDEALAAVAGSEVDDFMVLEEIFCQLFSACEHAHDVARADQWIRDRRGDRRSPTASGDLRVLPHALRRRADRRRTLARGRRRADRSSAALGPRSALALAQRRPRPPRRSPRHAGTIRGSRAVARRTSTSRPTPRRPAPSPRSIWSRARRRSPSTSSSAPSTRSIR